MNNYLVNDEICHKAELIETLQKFITQSNLAEFENRLNLLFVFHCHASHLPKTQARGKKDTFILFEYNISFAFQKISLVFFGMCTRILHNLRKQSRKKLKNCVRQ